MRLIGDGDCDGDSYGDGDGVRWQTMAFISSIRMWQQEMIVAESGGRGCSNGTMMLMAVADSSGYAICGGWLQRRQQ